MKRLYDRARRLGAFHRGRPIIDLDHIGMTPCANEGVEALTGSPRVRALLVDREFKPLGLRVLRDLRVSTRGSTFDEFVATARGRVDGKQRFTARLTRVWAYVPDHADPQSLVVIMAESDM